MRPPGGRTAVYLPGLVDYYSAKYGPPKLWYSPGEIRLQPPQVVWLLEHLLELIDGIWPPDPKDTGYTDAPGKTSFKQAYFETPIGWACEIEARLKLCGKDGTLTRQCLAEGWDTMTLAELMGTDAYRIQRRIRRCVQYCSGWKRRKITYNEFIQKRKLPAKHDIAVSKDRNC